MHRGITTERVDGHRELETVIEHCVVRMFPTEDPRTEVRITGIYISPAHTKELTLETLEKMGSTAKGVVTGEDVPHLLIGALNTSSWKQLYSEWVGTQGLHELVDPDIPTYAMGPSIDKILFLPGFYIPSSLLPPGDGRFLARETLWERPYFPAAVLDYPMFSDHSPVMVPLSSDAQTKKGGGGKTL